ncbi:MAG: TonB-dependent receptor plug domain-containing protein, partial [Verrucomicrobia bacterium]|nr:TonB-dependent receptor plug domain-containing protein [Verrucomicrobiota bacterium]
MKTRPVSVPLALAIALTVSAGVSFAQTPVTVPNPQAAKPAEKKEGTVSIDAVEVTGSRIRGLLGEADFSPVISFSRQEIEQTGLTNMGEISRLIPQAFSQGSYDGIGFGGQAQGQSTVSDGSTASVLTQRTNVNLRGLGAASTLILVNGRRVARSGNIRGSDGYDLTGIPVASIERVEILTDGASAIY